MTASDTAVDIILLRKKYFPNAQNKISLKKGDILIHEDQNNDRLFLVTNGLVAGYGENPDGSRFKLFKAYPDMLLGVYSFFSKNFKSSATIIAEKDSELLFLTWDEIGDSTDDKNSFVSAFMPLVLRDLLSRQDRIEKISLEKKQAMKKLIHSAKMVSIGQMAAGIAHELNNSLSVLKSNALWIGDNLVTHLKGTFSDYQSFFNLGLQKGRSLSSMEIREKGEIIEKRLKIPLDQAKRLAQTNINEEELSQRKTSDPASLDNIFFHWEVGAIIHDMIAAANQSSHVVKSVKSLGRPGQIIHQKQDINETITIAIALLRNSLKKIQVKTILGLIPPIQVSKGDMIQVWINLLKNAFESIEHKGLEKGEIVVTSYSSGEVLTVTVEDNGPGIPKEKIESIFEPNMTTKITGLSFGLGLGLPIVERILENNKGNITVSSSPEKTIFTVTFSVN